MSTPFLIFMAALVAIGAWALISRILASRRLTKITKAEEALDTRMLELQERIRNRNARIFAEQVADRKEKPAGDKSPRSSVRAFYGVEDRAMPLPEDLFIPVPATRGYMGTLHRRVYAPVLRALGSSVLLDNEEYEVAVFARRFGLDADDVRDLIDRGSNLEAVERAPWHKP
ncbi:hypothetical protein [Mesorhizobium sp. ES1-3]|uniref:hypothetical protein n=1 Tax=Mesorhizobium sp. ES1-3 TaxID=2876628 RepID=UPI001CC9B45C|nr:hypothetical protein [Mesorhizobium sp. ES1-3]MBZ9673312.1 hypothetical protein [Mesorhizobium sp. ES1-3]